MSVEIFEKLGVRYRHFKTHPNRWSDGKVHLQRWYSKPWKQWVLLCRHEADLGAGFGGYFGTEVEPEELTCKKCIKLDPRERNQ